VSALVAIVSANFNLLIFRVSSALHVGVENHELYTLDSNSIADEFNRKLFIILPLVGLQLIKDSASIAVFFFQTLYQHALKHFSGKSLIIIRVDFDFYLSLFGLLSLLCLFLFGEGILELFLFVFKIFGGFIGERMVTLLPKVNQIAHANDASLVLLCHIVSRNCFSTAGRSNQDNV